MPPGISLEKLPELVYKLKNNNRFKKKKKYVSYIVSISGIMGDYITDPILDVLKVTIRTVLLVMDP